MAAEAFSQAGYDAHNMTGGITAWVDAENCRSSPRTARSPEPRPVVMEAGAPHRPSRRTRRLRKPPRPRIRRRSSKASAPGSPSSTASSAPASTRSAPPPCWRSPPGIVAVVLALGVQDDSRHEGGARPSFASRWTGVERRRRRPPRTTSPTLDDRLSRARVADRVAALRPDRDRPARSRSSRTTSRTSANRSISALEQARTPAARAARTTTPADGDSHPGGGTTARILPPLVGRLVALRRRRPLRRDCRSCSSSSIASRSAVSRSGRPMTSPSPALEVLPAARRAPPRARPGGPPRPS